MAQTTLQRLEKLHRSKQGLAFYGLVETGLSYVFASWAIDSGSLLQWGLAIVLGIGALQNFVKLAFKVLKKD